MKISQLLKKIVFDSGLPLSSFAKSVGLSHRDALSWWSGDNISLSLKHLHKFENHFGVQLSSDGDIDMALLRKRVLGDMTSLPRKISRRCFQLCSLLQTYFRVFKIIAWTSLC